MVFYWEGPLWWSSYHHATIMVLPGPFFCRGPELHFPHPREAIESSSLLCHSVHEMQCKMLNSILKTHWSLNSIVFWLDIFSITSFFYFNSVFLVLSERVSQNHLVLHCLKPLNTPLIYKMCKGKKKSKIYFVVPLIPPPHFAQGC